MSFFWDPYIFVLTLSFLASLTVFYKLNAVDSYLRYFPPFLLATILIELLGLYLNGKGRDNILTYNFFTAFEFCFYMWIVNLIINEKQVKKIIRITILVYAIIAAGNIIFIQTGQFHTVTYALGCLMVVVVCIYYFFELFRLPRSIKLSSNPAFWICSGLLFFYCCGFPLFGLLNYWSGISKLVLKNFGQILTILNVFLYSLFTLAFLCIRTRKYTLSPS
ncbi:MAG: hypothetical protein ABIR18_12370 [Chitinophagaceae bacterium]